MVIGATLIVLFGLFFFVKKHIGPSLLAVIAGLSVYEMFGTELADFLHRFFESAPTELLQNAVLLAFVLAFPLILYIRSYKGGLYGILRVAEAALFAAFITLMIAPAISYFANFDALSTEIVGYIESYRGLLVLAAVGTAYFDLLMYHE